MTDTAFDLIRPALLNEQGQCIWIADENLTSAQIPPRDNIQVLSNRFDLHQSLQQQGWQAQLSDFDLSQVADQSIDALMYRVSKEKPVVHHIINEASRVLKVGGRLLISGEKNEGIKSYISKAKKLFDGACDAEKADKNYWLAELTRPSELGPMLDDQGYRQLRITTSDQHYSFISKPGLFGWDKIDQGSAFLIDQLDAMLSKQSYGRVLDLGCGYGFLSRHVISKCNALVATDNNIAAIQACNENLAEFDHADVIAANCAEGITGPFDTIICNPPFHSGFSVENSLTDRFLAMTSTKLATDGTAYFVVNKHIALERKASSLFKSVETFADNGSFKLVRLSQPIRAKS